MHSPPYVRVTRERCTEGMDALVSPKLEEHLTKAPRGTPEAIIADEETRERYLPNGLSYAYGWLPLPNGSTARPALPFRDSSAMYFTVSRRYVGFPQCVESSAGLYGNGREHVKGADDSDL